MLRHITGMKGVSGSLSKVAGDNVPAHLTYFIGDDHIALADGSKSPLFALEHHHAAVHIERVAGDVSGSIAGKEYGASRNLIGGAKAAGWYFL